MLKLDIQVDLTKAQIATTPAIDGRIICQGNEYPLTAGKAVIAPEHPRLWSPEDPYLYDFVIETETDNNYFVFTIILVAVGLVLLIGAGLILYFCVLRKPKTAKKNEKDEMTDLYSDDLPMMDGDINEDGEIVIAPMDDIVDLPPQKFADGIVFPDFSEDGDE